MQNEVWPFQDESTGCKVQENRFYGFGDAGSLAGTFEGYASREEAMAEISRIYELTVRELGWKQEHLGDYAVAVLSGREFVDQLVVINGDDDLENYGKWSENERPI